jgi:uncharacterized protein (DUF1330 family)
MPAYYFVDIREVKDPAKMDEYRARVPPVVEKFGGSDWRPMRSRRGFLPACLSSTNSVPSMKDARQWYDSQDYHDLKQLRLDATVSNGIFIHGV